MTMTMPCEPYLKTIGKFHIDITVALCAATLICETEWDSSSTKNVPDEPRGLNRLGPLP